MERVFGTLSEALGARGHDVYSVYTSEEPYTLQVVRRPHHVSFDLSLTTLHTRMKLPTPTSAARMAYDAVQLHGLLRRLRPNVVNLHFPSFSTAYFYLLRRLHDYPIVVSTHGSDVLQDSQHIGRRLAPYLLRGADHITAVSTPLEREARVMARGTVPSTVIGNGIDFDAWTEAHPSPPDARSQPPVIANLGTLRPLKGHDVLLRAFAQVRARTKARLWLMGDGPAREDLEALAADLEIREEVVFHGWCSREEVGRKLQQSTVFAFPSRSEGFGLALLEAMATGLPVVASRTGGIPDLIAAPSHGVLVEPDAPDRLAEALHRILDSPEQWYRLAQGARNRAQDFHWETVVDAYERLFSDVARPAPPPAPA
jgi:glycosyltransferase involved in cell wall biosynthesis